jgi:hypothetical protein
MKSVHYFENGCRIREEEDLFDWVLQVESKGRWENSIHDVGGQLFEAIVGQLFEFISYALSV